MKTQTHFCLDFHTFTKKLKKKTLGTPSLRFIGFNMDDKQCGFLFYQISIISIQALGQVKTSLRTGWARREACSQAYRIWWTISIFALARSKSSTSHHINQSKPVIKKTPIIETNYYFFQHSKPLCFLLFSFCTWHTRPKLCDHTQYAPFLKSFEYSLHLQVW